MIKYLFILFLLAGCKTVEEGDQLAKIYPEQGVADVAVLGKVCPLKVAKVTRVPVGALSGWVCMPEDQYARYRRQYESECK